MKLWESPSFAEVPEPWKGSFYYANAKKIMRLLSTKRRKSNMKQRLKLLDNYVTWMIIKIGQLIEKKKR